VTITLDLDAETEAGLIAAARATGMSLEQYIRMMVEKAVGPTAQLTPAERAAAWIASAEKFPETRLLSDEAIGRDAIYGDRG
jgi:hypothetical protein